MSNGKRLSNRSLFFPDVSIIKIVDGYEMDYYKLPRKLTNFFKSSSLVKLIELSVRYCSTTFFCDLYNFKRLALVAGVS